MVLIFFWLVTLMMTAMALVICYPGEALRLVSTLKRYLHKQYARRYGVEAADDFFPLDFLEAKPWERLPVDLQQEPALTQLYIVLHGHFLQYVLGLKSSVGGLKVSKSEALRLFIIGFLLRWNLARLTPKKQ